MKRTALRTTRLRVARLERLLALQEQRDAALDRGDTPRALQLDREIHKLEPKTGRP